MSKNPLIFSSLKDNFNNLENFSNDNNDDSKKYFSAVDNNKGGSYIYNNNDDNPYHYSCAYMGLPPNNTKTDENKIDSGRGGNTNIVCSDNEEGHGLVKCVENSTDSNINCCEPPSDGELAIINYKGKGNGWECTTANSSKWWNSKYKCTDDDSEVVLDIGVVKKNSLPVNKYYQKFSKTNQYDEKRIRFPKVRHYTYQDLDDESTAGTGRTDIPLRNIYGCDQYGAGKDKNKTQICWWNNAGFCPASEVYYSDLYSGKVTKASGDIAENCYSIVWNVPAMFDPHASPPQAGGQAMMNPKTPNGSIKTNLYLGPACNNSVVTNGNPTGWSVKTTPNHNVRPSLDKPKKWGLSKDGCCMPAAWGPHKTLKECKQNAITNNEGSVGADICAIYEKNNYWVSDAPNSFQNKNWVPPK
jgi:hypothetical protein